MPHPINDYTGLREYKPYRMPYSRPDQRKQIKYELRQHELMIMQEREELSDRVRLRVKK